MGYVPEKYSEYVRFETRQKESRSWSKHTQWWSRRSNRPASIWGRQGDQDGYRHSRVRVPLPQEFCHSIARRIDRAPAKRITVGLSEFVVYATALSIWLYLLADSDNYVCIGATSHGRSTPRFKDTSGLFMQLLPFVVSIEVEDSIDDVIGRVATESAGFLKHGVPGSMTPSTSSAFPRRIELDRS